MVDEDLVIGQRGDMPLVQDLHFGLGRDGNLVTEQSRPLGTLVQNHEHDIDLRPVDDVDIGLEQDIGDSYFLAPVISQEMALSHGEDGEYDNEYSQGSEYENKYDPVDQKTFSGESRETGLIQDDSCVDNHDRRLAIVSSSNELHFSEGNEMAVLENCEVDESFEVMHQNNDMVIVSPPHHSGVRPQVLTTSPIVQSRIATPLLVQEFNVGQEFPDVKSCRRALRDLAIALHFEIQTVKSDKTRFTAKCASEDCPWRVHAAKLPGVPTFTIRTIHSEHNCGGIAHLGHQQASIEWVANSVEERLKENPHYKPKEILEDIHRVHGITLSYKQAWRGKERFMASLRGSFEEDYRLLPQYCNQIRRTNPGSMASVCVNPIDNSFQRLFISYQASIYGFLNACRPLIGLDRTVLKNKYLGTLLFATSFDGDGTLFPLAFGVVDEENDESWTWFLSELHKLLDTNTENMPRLTILSDRQKSIVDAVELNFPTAFHGFCMLHLSESFRKEFNDNILSELLWEAANALTVVEFDSKILEIEEISQDAAFWVRKVPPHLWANSYFEGSRLGNLTANVVESLNAWILEASGLPIVQMMECIRRQLMTWFNERREASMQWSSTLVPSAERQVSEALDFARSYQVLRANEAEFEVISHEGTNIVDVRSRCCSCRGWEVYGLPCSHAVAALLSCRQNVHRFSESCFTVASFRKAYSQTIHPIPDRTLWHEISGDQQQGEEDMVVNPPKSLRPPAQSRKRRAPTGERSRARRVVHCSRCYQTGHFRTTCAAPI
ncbi:MuDR family transposase [Perilla frutescens var. frutescens]|nr:MuDR family transposase [Perilla frutescens var. frutescens]